MCIIDASTEIKKQPNKKVVFITGVTGQDGSYMVDYLLKTTDYIIVGGARRLSVPNHKNLNHLDEKTIKNRFYLVNFDLSDTHAINSVLQDIKPDYFINFAAQTFVGSSWDFPAQTWECNTTGVIHILEAIRKHKPSCRIYNAGSSEEFGNVLYTPQDEQHPCRPRSPYGASKAAARQLIKVYRESYNLYAIQGLLYNHESSRRGEEFVTRKITLGIAKIKAALESGNPFDPIELGNVYAKRDWSDANDFVDGIWKMLNQDPKNIKEYILSSGETHTIKEFIEIAFKYANINGIWHGNGLGEEFSLSKSDFTKYNAKSSVLIKINQKFYRPAEVDLLHGNSDLVRKELGWTPKTTFEELVKKMVESDMHLQ
jgi:GDPmannose 4,6-dehydratase